jgi:O-antigen/teichoic acid export membrane protein
MLISLYTSRVILNALGVEDYGIYNVVGGFVTMFSMLSSSLNAAISRFITFELGSGDSGKLQKIFSSSVTIQIGISLIIILLAETVGLWFVNTQLVIPEERMSAANWCYHFSIITFAINLISVPYNASIIAHEKMSAFAYISILEAIGKLTIAWCININTIDRLVFFAAMVAVLAWIIRLIYASYCKRNFEECQFSFVYDHELLKRMFSFAGWTFLGNTAGILNSHGVNVLSNMFFGVGVNAARGIAEKVNAVMTQFVNNFTTAVNPQITKSYAKGDEAYLRQLIYSGARLSCYLYLFFAIPIGFEAEYILKLWLKIVPDYTVVFVRWTLASAFCLIIGNSILTSLLATGEIKKYQIIISLLGILDFPLTYAAYKLGFSPISAYVLYFSMYFSLIFVRYKLVKVKVPIDFNGYIINVVFRTIIVTLLASVFSFIVIRIMDSTFLRLLTNLIVSIISLSIIIPLMGLTNYEKTYLINKITKLKNEKFD